MFHRHTYLCLLSLLWLCCQLFYSPLARATEANRYTPDISQLKPGSQRSWAWLAAPWVAQSLGWRPAEYQVVAQPQTQLLTPDGISLVADLYHPLGAGPAPTLLIRIPLDDNETGALFSEAMGQLFASRGYHVMIQGVRGRYGSSGQHLPFAHEREDGLATLHWLQQQPWHNGKVGMWGGSYFGYTQWVLADQADSGLSALLIQIASTDHRQLFHPGGALAYETALFWATRSYAAQDSPLTHEKLLQAMQGGPPLSADQRAVGQEIPFYRDWLQHVQGEQADAFWQAVDGQQRARTANVPILLMAGWYDPFLPSQLEDFKQLQQAPPLTAYSSRLIIGPWSHAETMTLPDGYRDLHYRLASIKPALAWYDQHLLGRSLHPFPAVQAFVSGVNQWHSFEQWPPVSQTEVLFLKPSAVPQPGPLPQQQGLLSPQPDQQQTLWQFSHDPADPVPSEGGAVLLSSRSGPWLQSSQQRPDVLGFQTPALSAPLTVVGELTADLWFASSVPATDVVVKLLDLHPNGKAYGISQGIVRTHFQPGQPQVVKVSLWPVGHVFLKGHRLRLEVASSHFPMFAVHPSTGTDPLSSQPGPKAQQTVYLGGEQASRLYLPVLPGLPAPR